MNGLKAYLVGEQFGREKHIATYDGFPEKIIQTIDPAHIVIGNNTIRVEGPDSSAIIATILAHLNGATHEDPR